MVFANKCDLAADVVVFDEEIKAFSEQHKIPVIKTSAKTGESVDDSFLEMTKNLIVKRNASGKGQDDKKRTMGLAMKKMQLGKDANKNGGAGGMGGGANGGKGGGAANSGCCQ